MENKGKLIGVGIVAIIIIWCLLTPKVNDMTQMELMSITNNLIQTDVTHLCDDVYKEQVQKGAGEYDKAIGKVQALKKDASGRGNKAAINYTKNMLELYKKIVGDADTYKKIKNGRIHSIIVEYFWNVNNEISDKPVSGLEFDSMLLWLYNNIFI